jgi:hypothetical protein
MPSRGRVVTLPRRTSPPLHQGSLNAPYEFCATTVGWNRGPPVATRHATDDQWVVNVTSNVSLHEMSVPHVMVIVSVPEAPSAWRFWKLIASLPWQLSAALS